MKKVTVYNVSPEKISVFVGQKDDEISIKISEARKASICGTDRNTYERRLLKDFSAGMVVEIGCNNYIVLNQGKETTALISEDFINYMPFGESAEYSESMVHNYLNNKFYKSLAAVVGKENIIRHTVNLEADNGTGKGKNLKTNISLLTTNLYRKYREYIPAAQEDYWWTATKVDAEDECFKNDVNFISESGLVLWGNCTFEGGVRPYFILNSLISVKDGSDFQ